MKLKDWQKSKKVSNKKLATMLGVHPSYITHINKGTKVPSSKMILRIQGITSNKVLFRDFLSN